jgi:DMSO reductase anchor subunit
LLLATVATATGAPIFNSAGFMPLLRAGLETGAPVIGLLGVFCSVMIYHDTHRTLWHGRRSGPLFFGTALLLGAAGAAIIRPGPVLLVTVMATSVAKLVVELLMLKKTALLITGKFQTVAFARLLCLMLGGLGLPLLIELNVFASPVLFAALAFTLLLLGELLERCLFFTTVVAPKMPGGLPG